MSTSSFARAEIRTLLPESTPEVMDASQVLFTLGLLHSTPFASVTEATDAYLTFVMRALGVRSAFVGTLDANFLHIINARNEQAGGCDIASEAVIPIEDTLCQYVRASGAPVIITNVSNDARVQDIVARTKDNIGAYIGVPLIFSNGDVHGTICALDPQPRQFTQMHVDLLRIVARHTALLLECAQTAHADELVQRNQSMAVEALDEQSTVLKTVVHDLRNPISGMQGYIDLFLHDLLGPISEEQRGVLLQMARGTRFITRLINDLMDAAAAETHTLHILNEAFDPCALGQSVLESYRAEATKRNLALHFYSDPSTIAMIGDADRLRQILLNLISNALRCTRAGGVTLRIITDTAGVQFEVADSGPGIPVEDHASIWQLHIRRGSYGQGLGLGLYIVKRLAQAMGGEVGLHSALEEGSTFWVYLPLQGMQPQKFTWK